MKCEPGFYRALFRATLTIVTLIAVAPAAGYAQKTPQFQVRFLEIPSPFTHSDALRIKRGAQGDLYAVGSVWGPGAIRRAAVWNLTDNVVDLLPLLNDAQATGLGAGDSIAGFGWIGGWHALLWPNTGSAAKDLHPADAYASAALDASGGQQVGYVEFSSGEYAMLWNSKATSVVGLHPTGFAHSYATGIDGSQQVGWGRMPTAGGSDRALLWYGTSNSMVDLHPTGYSNSYAWGVSQNAGVSQQVGMALTAGGATRAMLWRNNAASAANLNPAGFSSSQANAVDVYGEPALVGQVGVGRDSASDSSHALYWRGTASSVTDLHSFLPAEYVESSAKGISSTGEIVGTAETNWGPSEAVMWERFVLTSLTLNPATIRGGQNSTGTVRINLPAPQGGAIVSLGPLGPFLNPPTISLPATITIPEGATSATFTIRSQVNSGTARSFNVTATYSGFTRSATLTVNPSITLPGNP